MKTNAVRCLDNLGIAYQLLTYEVDLDDLTAESTAIKVNRPQAQVFKTLVARGDRHGVCLAVIPSHAALDLKALANVTGDRKINTVPLKDVQPLTGYLRGGVTALACKKRYPVYLDETAAALALICVSGGMRGLLIELAPADYCKAVDATWGAIAQRQSRQCC
ncbi:MAG TPA: Cys-tRNA(Pro) deacylase [Synechococcales cyanobacterium M55_K2018_004]|nr:Cys-tRNA(Pro) deacylase [Synechococcales cyanobacterium M55_K2018_004]